MTQFRPERCRDFLSQMVLNGQEKAKRNHFATNYGSCGKTLSLRPKLADVRALEVGWPPDMEAVGPAEAQFATAATAAEQHERHGSIQVLFDSFSQHAPAGMRSAPMRVREVVFRAEPYQLHIQVEAQEDHNRLVVTGQLLDVSHPDIVGLEVRITLSNLRGSVVQTMTNQFGEFRGELEDSGDLEVSFLPRSGNPIVILLRGALKQSSGAKQ